MVCKDIKKIKNSFFCAANSHTSVMRLRFMHGISYLRYAPSEYTRTKRRQLTAGLCGLLLIILLITCKSNPAVPEGFLQDEKFLPLDSGASVYLIADVPRARSILGLLPIEELNDSQVKQMLDRTDFAAAAFFPAQSGRRFQLSAWGNYPSFQAGFAFAFNKNWKKRNSPSGGSYWYSAASRLSLAVNSKQVFAASSLNSTPVDPLSAGSSSFSNQTGIEIPDGFNTFRVGSPLSCWLTDPGKVISGIFENAGIPIQFPVKQLFINLFPAGENYEAVLNFQLESSMHARGMAAMLNLASAFISGEPKPQSENSPPNSGLIFAALLFKNPPSQNDRSLEIKTGILNETEIKLMFNIFFGI